MGSLSVFAKNLRLRRKASRMTQGQLAALIGVSVSFIADIEGEKKAPSFQTIDRLSYALDTPVWLFFCEEGEIAGTGDDADALAYRLKKEISEVVDTIIRKK